MKKFFLPILLAFPLFCSAQHFKTVHMGPSNMSDVGQSLTSASSFLLGGTALELIGGGIIGYSAHTTINYRGQKEMESEGGMYAGIASAGVGLICQIIGFIKIGKAGRALRDNETVSFSGNGISLHF